jgi:hypothetical protein
MRFSVVHPLCGRLVILRLQLPRLLERGLVTQLGAAESIRVDAACAWKERIIVWWQDLLWGLWNGLTAWIVLIVHVFGGWEQYPFYDVARSGNWYDFGFLLGAGSPFLGVATRSRMGGVLSRLRR